MLVEVQSLCSKANSKLIDIFRDVTTDFTANCRLRIERTNSTLMTCHYPDVGSAFDYFGRAARKICCFKESDALLRSWK